jgi:hypothetical protein
VIFRPDRSRVPGEKELRWVYPKVFLFLVGACLGIAGMTLHIDWLITAGVIVLAFGLLLRLLSRRADSGE